MHQKISTGIEGLDQILKGGLIPNRTYLLKGGPGTGKSTLGYHFLREGLDQQEDVLYITLEENKPGILENAQKLNIDLSKAHFLDLFPSDNLTENSEDYDVFPISEVEKKPIIESIVDTFQQHRPSGFCLIPPLFWATCTKIATSFATLASPSVNTCRMQALR